MIPFFWFAPTCDSTIINLPCFIALVVSLGPHPRPSGSPPSALYAQVKLTNPMASLTVGHGQNPHPCARACVTVPRAWASLSHLSPDVYLSVQPSQTQPQNPIPTANNSSPCSLSQWTTLASTQVSLGGRNMSEFFLLFFSHCFNNTYIFPVQIKCFGGKRVTTVSSARQPSILQVHDFSTWPNRI